jgi:hypothetical protein
MIWDNDKLGFILLLFIIGSMVAFVVATEKNKWDVQEQECISKKGYYLRTRDAQLCIKENTVIKLKGES